MQQLTTNVFVETQVRGCNFGYVTTSDGIVMIGQPHRRPVVCQLLHRHRRITASAEGLAHHRS